MKRYLYYGACAFLLFGLPVAAETDGMLSTKEGDCSFYYPTHKNTQGWYIKVTPTDMCRNGVVNAHGEVTIYNAFSKPVEQFYGFFNGGYWTGDAALSADILFRRSENGARKVFFSLPAESGLDVQYIGQMTAQKQKDNTFGPFMFCNPFRLLVQTQDFELFTNRDLTTELIDEAAKITRHLCPAEKQIFLYASVQDKPAPEDIFFFAEINLQTAQITVKRNEAARFAQKYVSDAVAPDVSHVPDLKPNKTVVPVLSAPEAETRPASFAAAIDGDGAFMDDGSDIMPPAVIVGDTLGDIITPVPKQVSAVSSKQVMDTVPHLLTAGRILKKPIYGTAVVEITRLTETGGVAARPARLQLKGIGLQTGWGVVSGDFAYESGKTADTLAGTVTVASFVPCAEAFCKDIK
ncbi:MAG: hypothetical protein ACI4QM_02650 [Alphaproteobacteria bacterium]